MKQAWPPYLDGIGNHILDGQRELIGLLGSVEGDNALPIRIHLLLRVRVGLHPNLCCTV